MSAAGIIPKHKKKAMRRIVRDISNASEIESLGIYVSSNPDNIFEARALIIGPEKTPYENGYFLFHITFPDNYPFNSPTVKFMTGDGKTRFHPNLYIKGKVCLSILGTWQGPSWTSSQSLSSVLTTIQSLLDDNPLRNEPGFQHGKGKRYVLYNNVVRHAVYATSVMIQLEKCPKHFEALYPHMKKHFIENFDWFICKLNELAEKYDGNIEKSSVYGTPSVKYDYRGILNGLIEVHNGFTGGDSMIVTADTLKFVSNAVVV